MPRNHITAQIHFVSKLEVWGTWCARVIPYVTAESIDLCTSVNEMTRSLCPRIPHAYNVSMRTKSSCTKESQHIVKPGEM